MIKMANLTCLPNLVSLAQWEQVSPDYYSSSYYYYSSSSATPTIRARLVGPTRLRKNIFILEVAFITLPYGVQERSNVPEVSS